MGKRVIPRRTRRTSPGVLTVEAGDFGDTVPSAESGDVQHADELLDENSGGEHRGEFLDPESAAGSDRNGNSTGDSAGNGKRRGRRKGTRNKNKAAESSITQSLLFSIHSMGAAFLKCPYLMITVDESQALADAVNKVQEQYEISFLTEKQLAWVQLAMVGASIYGPRLVAAVHDAKQQKLEKQRNPAQIVTMPDLNEVKRQQNVQAN